MAAGVPLGPRFSTIEIPAGTVGPWSEPRSFRDAADRLLNGALAFLLLVPALPLIVLVALVILLADGWPVLHGGWRLGRNKRPFKMYKFRTLVRGAEEVLGAELVSHRHRLTIRFGRFLRDTRLDELPQLLNILRGDMRFVGPRPERPEVYIEQCRAIENYDRRFSAKPGLIGYSQLFTPHSTPKRFRALIDNRLLGRRYRPFSDLLLIPYTALVIGRTIARKVLKALSDRLLRRGIGRGGEERRELARVRVEGADAIWDGDGEGGRPAPIVDLNDSAFLMLSPEPIQNLPPTLKLRIRVARRRGGVKVKSATCRGEIRQVRRTADGYGIVVGYQPATPASHYVIDQYFLARSLARPPRLRLF